MGGSAVVVVLGQPDDDPLQHPCMAQVQAVEVHEFAVSRVSHRRFETLGPTICLAGTRATSRRRQSKLVQSTGSFVSHTSDWLKGHLIAIKHLGHTLLALRVLTCPLKICNAGLGFVMYEPKASA